MVLVPSLTIIRMQGFRFELRISQTLVFVGFLNQFQMNTGTSKNIKVHFWEGNPQRIHYGGLN